MRKLKLQYWLCQILGWGGWAFLNLFMAYQFASDYYLNPIEKRKIFFIALAIDFFWGILATHILRLILKRINWIKFSNPRVMAVFFLGVLFAGLLQFHGAKFTSKLSKQSFDDYVIAEKLEKAKSLEKDAGLSNTEYYQYKKIVLGDSSEYFAATKINKATGWKRDAKGIWKYEEQRKGGEFWNYLFTFILVSMWLLIYLVWHYIIKNRKDQLDKVKLETTVKELELKTIKSHINPHFIFNSLNSIRALVDENPTRARTAITELSNILRSSMKANTAETVSLQKELDIVKDYLALEQMRFEERLKIEFDIDPNTLQQPIPPMMLQTLVENAVKHGISKLVNGGVVRIVAHFKDSNLELLVQNTGHLNNPINTDGFGIKSTENRLKLMYANNAIFEIKNLENNQVQCRLTLPATP